VFFIIVVKYYCLFLIITTDVTQDFFIPIENPIFAS